MSFYKRSRTLPERFRLILASFLQRPGLPFADALPEEAIQEAFDDEDASFADDKGAVYTPAITLWAFLSQVLFKDEQRSCFVRPCCGRRASRGFCRASSASPQACKRSPRVGWSSP